MLEICLRAMAAQLGAPVSDAQVAAFGGSVVDWPAFADSPEALQRLQTAFAIVTITNCDDDLFAASETRLGISFDAVITAQQVGRYKPDTAGFHVAHERIERELGHPEGAHPARRAEPLPRSRARRRASACRPSGSTGARGSRAVRRPSAAPVEPDARFTTMRAFADDAVPDEG